jgi:LAO/AO transport system kinase
VVDADALIERLVSDSRALPRLATLVENDDPRGLDLLDVLYPRTGQAHIVGVTGPPGSGKSTLIAALLKGLRETGRRVAVLAIDPSSPLTGGAVLGDRIRMMERHADAGVFVRSMASRGRKGGLAWATAALVHVLDAAGYPLILIETVGTGQDGTDIAALADTVVVLEAPGLGDGVQAIKSGLLEVGDIVVVNKADQPGADDALRLLRAAFALAHPADGRVVPIVATTAATGEGVAALVAAIDEHAAWLDHDGRRIHRREHAARTEILTGLRTVFDGRVDRQTGQFEHLTTIISRVASRELSPRRAVASLLDRLAGS